MTKRVDASEHRRPRRMLGELLRRELRCPLRKCRGRLRSVAYRAKTARLECEACGLRFSVSPSDVGQARHRNLDSALSGPVNGSDLRRHHATDLEFLSLIHPSDTPEQRFATARAFLARLSQDR
jgi:hypothetical protein